MLYVIGDTHGCYTELMQLMEKIEKKDSNAEYVLIGDIYDRGKEIVPLCQWAIEHINNIDGRYKMIMGNHEWDAINIYNSLDNIEEHKSDWEIYKSSIFDYYNSLEQIESVDTYISIMEFFKTLPYYFDITRKGKRYIIVHADVPNEIVKEDGSLVPQEALTQKQQESIVWYRNYWGIHKPTETIVVHGHTPTLCHDYYIRHSDVQPGKVGLTLYSHQINIDCGCVYHYFGELDANLAALCLDTKEVTYLWSDDEIEEFKYQDFVKFSNRFKNIKV